SAGRAARKPASRRRRGACALRVGQVLEHTMRSGIMERRVDGLICWPLADQAAIDHVISLGHRRIGFCGKQGSHLWATDRRKAFVDTMRQRGLTPAVVEDVPKDDRSALTRLRH